jgi:hypothetical protein
MAKDIAASVRARLLTVAKAQSADYNQVLVRFALERILYRLSESAHADRFLLKGALLFTLWYDMPHRATRDADLLGFGPSDLDSVAQTFRDIKANPITVLEAVSQSLCDAVDPQPDAITFDFLDACRVCLTCELHHAQRRPLDLRRVTAAGHGNPHLTGELGREFVELERREQAEDRLWHSPGDGDETFVLGSCVAR